MLRFRFFLMVFVVISGCSATKKNTRTAVDLNQNPADSTEYQITISDPGFDQWYSTNYNTSKDHTKEYYHYYNMQGVSNWNEYYRTGRHDNVIGCLIEYWPDTDYGIEVNRRLFWYFKYIEENFGVRLFW